MSDIIARFGLTGLQILASGLIITFMITHFDELLSLITQLVDSKIISY